MVFLFAVPLNDDSLVDDLLASNIDSLYQIAVVLISINEAEIK